MAERKHFRTLREIVFACRPPSVFGTWKRSASGLGKLMTRYLPASLEPYVDANSRFETIRNLVAAAERGEASLSDVSSYIRASEAGEPKYSRTRPALLEIAEAVRSDPETEPRKTVYAGLADGRWGWDDVEAWETNRTVLAEARRRPTKGVYLTRGRRTRPHAPDVDGMYVPKMSLEAVCHAGVSDGAKACLAILMSLAGKHAAFTTYTSSVAARMGRTTRSVRSYFAALEGAGLITRTPGKRPNTVLIAISERCRPSPYQEPEHVAGFRLACRSSDPAVRMLAYSVARMGRSTEEVETDLQDRRKKFSAFNLESDSYTAERLATAAPPRRGGVTSYSDLEIAMGRRFGSSQRTGPGRLPALDDVGCYMHSEKLRRSGRTEIAT